MGSLMRWAYRRWWLVLIILVSGSLLALSQIPKVYTDASSKSLMIRGTEQERVYLETVEKFGSDGVVVVLVQDPMLFSPEKLQALDDLEKDLIALPHVGQYESLFTVSRLDGSSGFLDSGPLVEWVPETQEEADTVRRHALGNPLLVGNLVSPNAEATAINLYFSLPPGKRAAALETAEAVEEVIERHQAGFDRVFQLGVPKSWQTVTESLHRDMRTLIPLAVGVLLLLLMLATRSLGGALLPMITAGTSVLWTFGFMGAVGIPLNILTMIVPPLVIVLGSTEDIHLLAEYQAELKHTGDRHRAILGVTSQIGTAVMLTAITTFLGFLSISTNRIVMLRQFGLAAGFGMLVNPLITFLFTPVYLRFLGARKHRESARLPLDPFLDHMAVGLVVFLRRHPRLTMGGLWGFAVLVGIGGWKVKVDNDLLGYFRSDAPIVQQARELHERLSGAQIFFVRVSSGFPDTFLAPENLGQIDQLEVRMRETGEFDKVTGLPDFVRLINREINGGGEEFNALPESDGAISQFLLLLQPTETQKYATSDFSEVNLIVRHNINSSHELKAAIARIEAAAAEVLNPHFKCRVTGEGVLLNEAADSIASGQARSISLLLVIIFVIMAVMFVNVKASLLSLAPNIYPVMILFGIMGLTGVALNPGTCMVAVIAIGLALDDTIHLMTRYNRDMHRLRDEDAALDACVRSEFKPVLCTSIALALGFAVLGLSSFTPIMYFGLLSAVVMLFALVADLMITPVLLSRTKLLTLWDVIGLKLRDEVVQKSELFAGLSRSQIKRVVLLGSIYEYAAGESIYGEGDEGDTMFFVLEGRVRLWGHDTEGNAVDHAALLPSDVFGEINLLVPGERTETATADGTVKCVRFRRGDFERLRRVFPRTNGQVLHNLAGILGNRLVLAQWLSREIAGHRPLSS